jgi:hypothetical protein
VDVAHAPVRLPASLLTTSSNMIIYNGVYYWQWSSCGLCSKVVGEVHQGPFRARAEGPIFNYVRGEELSSDLQALCVYVTCDLALLALKVAGPWVFLHSNNAFMLPGVPFAQKSWEQWLKSPAIKKV